MKRKIFFPVLLAVLLVLGSVSAVLAASALIPWDVIAGGGAPAAGGTVAINDTLGQPVTGASSGGTVALNAGYWYAPDSGATALELLSFAAAVRSPLPWLLLTLVCGLATAVLLRLKYRH